MNPNNPDCNCLYNWCAHECHACWKERTMGWRQEQEEFNRIWATSKLKALWFLWKLLAYRDK